MTTGRTHRCKNRCRGQEVKQDGDKKKKQHPRDLALVNGVRQTSDMMDGATQGVIH